MEEFLNDGEEGEMLDKEGEERRENSIVLGEFKTLQSDDLSGLKMALSSKSNIINLSTELTNFKRSYMNKREAPMTELSAINTSQERGSASQFFKNSDVKNEEFGDQTELNLIDDNDFNDYNNFQDNTMNFDDDILPNDIISTEAHNILNGMNPKSKLISEDFMQRVMYQTQKWKESLQSYGIEIIDKNIRANDETYINPKNALKDNIKKFKRIVSKKEKKSKKNIEENKNQNSFKLRFDVDYEQVEEDINKYKEECDFSYLTLDELEEYYNFESESELKVDQIRAYNYFFGKEIFERTFTKKMMVSEYIELVNEEDNNNYNEEENNRNTDEINFDDDNPFGNEDFYDNPGNLGLEDDQNFDQGDGNLQEIDINQNLNNTEFLTPAHSQTIIDPKMERLIIRIRSQNFNITQLKKIIWEDFVGKKFGEGIENQDNEIIESNNHIFESSEFDDMCVYLIVLYHLADKKLTIQTIILTVLHLCTEKGIQMEVDDESNIKLKKPIG